MSIPLPEDLQRRYSNTAERRSWLHRLPGLLENAFQRWQVQAELVGGTSAWSGYTGVVVPVRTSDGAAAVVKISFPYDDISHEADTLRLWSGSGAVQLLADEPAERAMLLERLDADRSLQSAPMPIAIDIWGALMHRLTIRPDDRPQWQRIPGLAEQAERWNDELPANWQQHHEPFPRWLLEAALDVCQKRGAVGRRDNRDVLVHADLHGMNILAKPGSTGWREQDFLAIDPQGIVGEAEFALMPMLSNRLRDLAEDTPELALFDRLNLLCEAAGLDAEAGRQWTIAREVENALWYAGRADHQKDLNRSLWLASTLAGNTLAGLPHPHLLER